MFQHLDAIPWLVHLGFALAASAWLVRDILALRCLAIASYLVFVLYLAIGPTTPPLSYLGWYALFLVINTVQAARLFYDRKIRALAPEDRRIADEVFPAFDPLVVKRLLALARRATIQSERVLTREGQRARFVYLIAEGEVAVRVGGCDLAILGPGRFVGEIGLIADRPATATACALASPERPVRLLVWSQAALRRRLAKDDLLRNAILAAIGADLARKIDQNNLTVARPVPAATPDIAYAPEDLLPVSQRPIRLPWARSRARLPGHAGDTAAIATVEAAPAAGSTATGTGESKPSTACAPMPR